MPDSPATRRPQRRRLLDEVRDRIVRDYVFNGDVDSTGLLPSERELSERYGVSRVTLRASLRSLEEAGLISSRRGVGSEIRPGNAILRQGLDRLSSLDTFAREAGQTVTTEDLAFDRMRADARSADKLQVPVGHLLLVITRAKLIGGRRAAWLVDRLPSGVLPFRTVEDELSDAFLDVLLAHDEVGLEYADTEVEPKVAGVSTGRRLGVTRGRPLLHVDAIYCRADASVVAWSEAWLLPSHFRFVVRRRRQLG